MYRSRVALFTAIPFAAAFVLALTASCGSEDATSNKNNTGAGNSTSSGTGGNVNLGGFGTGGSGNTGNSGSDPCEGLDPSCQADCFGPTCNPPKEFPMPDDEPAPDNVTSDGVTKDPNGWIVLDNTKSKSDNLWVADDMNYNVGLVSKVRTKPFPDAPTYREIGRYVSVTCSSKPTGNKEGIVLGSGPVGGLCADGVNGCCARDAAGGAGWAVNVWDNRPSRTAVDLNGDVWVSNRSFNGQASSTKIAANLEDCVDRNNNGQIDTSSDIDDNGIITTDCDQNNLPDDGATVCTPGLAHEFYGLDDECILFTVNIGTPGTYGRPLALGPDPARPTGPSDAWAGLFVTGQFFRIDGVSGLVEDTVQIQPVNGVASQPYGAAVDFYGILWAPNVGQPYLFYFDTNQTGQQGMVQYPGGDGQAAAGFYGIAIDGYEVPMPDGDFLIQQIWMGDYGNGAGAGAVRYRPLRDQGFWGYGQGTWARAVFDPDPNTPGLEVRQGRGLGADNRSPTSFVWVALDGYPTGTSGYIGRIPVDIPDGTVQIFGNNEMLNSTQVGMTGAGVAADLDIWGVNQGSSSVVHFGVDPAGNVTSGPDIIPLDDNPALPAGIKPNPYTYSDFTGFGLRNFTNPQGYYALVADPHCDDGQTEYVRVEWDGDEPVGTNITVMARAAATEPGLTSATWTGKYDTSPADLKVAPGPLDPNPTNYIEVLFELTTDNDETPALKSFNIISICSTGIPG